MLYLRIRVVLALNPNFLAYIRVIQIFSVTELDPKIDSLIAIYHHRMNPQIIKLLEFLKFYLLKNYKGSVLEI